MDLILWRHAQASDALGDADDSARPLTPRGEKQAARIGKWLDRQLPESTRVLVSPALRAQQTVAALGRKFKTRDELAPGASPSSLLTLVDWPLGKGSVLVVGHQPMLGLAISQLLGLPEKECAVKKGAVWWLRSRQHDAITQALVVTVQTPETV